MMDADTFSGEFQDWPAEIRDKLRRLALNFMLSGMMTAMSNSEAYHDKDPQDLIVQSNDLLHAMCESEANREMVDRSIHSILVGTSVEDVLAALQLSTEAPSGSHYIPDILKDLD